MWALVEVVRVEQQFGGWSALVTLSNDGIPQSFRVREQATEPTLQEVTDSANKLIAILNEEGARHEFEAMLASSTMGPMAYQSVTQLTDRFRSAYLAATGTQAAMLATWMLDRITSGDLTDLQMQTAFGMILTGYQDLKSRMAILRDHWLAVESAQGE